jgi:hypothetical protein
LEAAARLKVKLHFLQTSCENDRLDAYGMA